MQQSNWPPPGFPLVQGDYLLTGEWMLYLPEAFARRIDDGNLVLWRPGLTMWLATWKNDHDESLADRVTSTKSRADARRFDEREHSAHGVTRFGYRLRDDSDDGPVESINAFVFTENGDLQISVYFDDLRDEAERWQIVESVRMRT